MLIKHLNNLKWSESESLSVTSNSLLPHGLHSPWNSPGQNTGMNSLSLLQGIFPTQRSIPGLRHCRWILYHLSHKGSPRTLEWVAYPFSSRFFRSRNRTGVSRIAGGFFTNWAIREALSSPYINLINPNSLGHQLFTSFFILFVCLIYFIFGCTGSLSLHASFL